MNLEAELVIKFSFLFPKRTIWLYLTNCHYCLIFFINMKYIFRVLFHNRAFSDNIAIYLITFDQFVLSICLLKMCFKL